VRLRDERVVEASQDHPRGGPDDPMTRAEIESKFRGNASLALPVERVSRVIDEIGALAAAADLHGLMQALTL
jgi:2-methylcitrate dehydratase PrpD